MTAMGIDRLTVSRILNHREGGVTRLYDRFTYDTPKRNALAAWSARLLEIVSATTAPEKVVTLARARRAARAVGISNRSW